MNMLNTYNFSTSPISQPARKLRRLENPILRTLRTQRFNEVYNRRNLNKRITGKSEVKELDAETGLYYYGARYLDPRTSRWLSGDPAIYEGDYLPSAPINDEARKRNQNLPGMGGIFNYVNMHVYHYGGNNPVMYIDPDGRIPQTYRSQNGTYSFSATTTVFGGIIRNAAADVCPIPFLGNLITYAIDSASGYRIITDSDIHSALENLFLNTTSELSQIIDYTSLIGMIGGSRFGDLSKGASIAGWILTGINIAYGLSRREENAMDVLVHMLFPNELTGNSHEMVVALYLIAKSKLLDLKNSGGLRYDVTTFGAPTNFGYDTRAIRAIRNELRTIRKGMMEE